MKKRQVAVQFTLLLLFISRIHAAPEKDQLVSSEIPLKREFPLDEKVNPCVDFHKYVCGKVEDSFKLREDRSSHMFAFSDSSERILKAKIDFFKNIENEKKLSKRAKLVKNYYLACMDEKSSVESEKATIEKFLAGLEKVKSVEQFAIYSMDQIQAGGPALYSFWTEPNKSNPNVYDVSTFANFMSLPEQSYYDNKELMSDYRLLMVELFRILNPQAEDAKIQSRVDKVFELEKDYIATFPRPEVLRQRSSEKREMNQSEFLSKYGNLGFRSLFKIVPKSIAINNPIPESFEFYKKNLNDLNLQAFKDFLTYSYVRDILDDSDPAYFKRQFEFRKKYLGGPAQRSDREERCTRMTMQAFNMEIDQILIPRLFPNFPGKKIDLVAKRIRESILQGIENNLWLSEAARKMAYRKTEKAKLYLIQPQTEKEWDFLPVQNYSSKNKLVNLQLFRKARFAKAVKELKAPTNLAAWGMGPLTVNAYYDSSANKFVLPIGILQFPFFDSEGDVIENLGAVGAVFGHELGHGIDDQGAKYDEEGRLKQWMNMQEMGEFSKRGSKMVEQFDKAGHNGRLTLGENIADLVGLSFAYNAAFPKGNGTAENKRKFFVSYSRLWCFVARPKAIESQLKTNPHALGWARINEQVKHQPAFAEAYECKSGDPMTLKEEDRIKIW